jgi:hypothetical protein
MKREDKEVYSYPLHLCRQMTTLAIYLHVQNRYQWAWEIILKP